MHASLDRPDLQFPAKQLARGMSAPTVGHYEDLKRLMRYLVNKVECVIMLEAELVAGELPESLELWVDADWAGDRTRKSTSGGVCMFAGCLVMSWSRTQQSYAMSSAESEYYAKCTGVVETRFVESMLFECGVHVRIRVNTDSSASK